MSSVMEPFRNKHGCLPPDGCKLPADKALPKIVVGGDTAVQCEATFLVKSDEVEEFMFDIMKHSWTLKAWFAYKIKDKDLKENHHLEAKAPTWQQVWNLFRQEGEQWAALYARRKTDGVHRTSWELHRPQSILDLFVCTLTVLNCKIQARSDLNDGSIRGLKWHNYYYEDEGKCFALYKFMLYQHRLFGIGRKHSIHAPTSDSSWRSWLGTYDSKIHKAATAFMKDTGWDPLSMLSSSLLSEPTVLYDRRQHEKTVTFVHTQDGKLRVHKRGATSVRQESEQGLRDNLRKLLHVKVKSVFTGRKNLPIESFRGLLAHIDSSSDPIVWLRNDSGRPKSPEPTPVEKPPQRDYSNHAVLKLEQLVERFSSQDHAQAVRARLSLVRENHIHSATFVEEVKEAFAPLSQSTTAQWQKLSERQHVCEEVVEDQAKFGTLRRFMSDLSDEQQGHAQQYLGLVNTSNPLAGLAAENLVKLSKPDIEEWETLTMMKDIFDAIKKEG